MKIRLYPAYFGIEIGNQETKADVRNLTYISVSAHKI